jgi:hypothetical protein
MSNRAFGVGQVLHASCVILQALNTRQDGAPKFGALVDTL